MRRQRKKFKGYKHHVSKLLFMGQALFFLISFYLLIFVPYDLTALAWLLMKRGEKPADWQDERQWKDMTRAALATLLLSLPGLAVLFLLPRLLGF
jgi:TRAP-type mannitol/chloroaromatic compound transport system permease small subunit